MKCKQGDTAKIIYSLRPENVGRIVKVAEYIGKFQQGDVFAFRGIPCQALVSDHYWWIEAEDLESQYGPAPKAYIADTWLEPIRPKDKKKMTQEEMEDEKFFMDMILG
jgi:hypothetical protein